MNKRLLFISPGNNLEFLGAALRHVGHEQGVALAAGNILTYQISDGLVPLAEVRRRAEAADLILFDIRAFPELVETLAAVRHGFPDKTFIPLMGGSMDVMRLCRMGPFSFDRFASSASPRSVDYRRVQQITGLIDKLGGMLPVAAIRHARVWVRVVRYWTAGGRQNITNLVRLIVRQYCGGTGPAPDPPVELPAHFLCDPDGSHVYRSLKAWAAAVPCADELPVVAVLHYSGLHREASLAGVRALARCMEGRARVLPIAANGVENLDALSAYLRGRGCPRIAAIVSLVWFRLDGGPMGGSTEKTVRLLAALNVPYCTAVTLYGREIATWQASPEGVSPVEAFATVVLPELDGALLPVPVLGVVRQEQDGFQTTGATAIPDRAAALADRVLAWTRLQRMPARDKKIAFIVYNYPPGPAHAGNASYLDTARSLQAILRRLTEAGYSTGPAGDVNPLHELLADAVHNDNGSGPWQGLRLSHAEYLRAWDALPEAARRSVMEHFGPPPGTVMADRDGFRIPGRWYGNILIAFQPARMPGEPDRRHTHDTGLPPHHQYLAFYRYLAETVNAVVHVGTHGTAEFTPGKQIGLSAQCFPDILRGDLPHLYLYTIANPAEAAIARRRLQACLVSHHVPDFVPAGLYGDYQELLDLVDRSRDPGISAFRRQELERTIRDRAAALDLPGDDPDALADELHELKHAAVPDGLHVFGTAKDGTSLAGYLARLFTRPLAGVCPADYCRSPGTLKAWARAFVVSGALPRALAGKLAAEQRRSLEAELRRIARDYLADREIAGLLHALEGRYVEPGLMGDCLRSPQVYPTGRNGCSFDPTRIPFPDAVARGAALGRQLVEHHVRQTGRQPKTVGLVLWGFETARSGGETIGVFLYLIGARLKAGAGWLPAFEPVPAAELGRPRIDVYLMICGFFRDMFPTLVRDLDRLVAAVAACDEPPELNPLRARLAAAAGGTAGRARIFGPAQGAYGTAIPDHVAASQWSDRSDIGGLYQQAMGYAYGADAAGAPVPQMFADLLAATDAVSQIVDGEEYKIGDLDHYYEFLGGACRAVENLRGERPQCLVGDSARSRPRIADAGDELRRCTVTRLLNPVWINGMLRHALHGAKKIEERVTNLVGLAATVGVPSQLFDRVYERFLEDEELFQRLRDNNPHATLSLARRMAEAAQRELWQASPEQLSLIKQRHAALEAELE